MLDFGCWVASLIWVHHFHLLVAPKVMGWEPGDTWAQNKKLHQMHAEHWKKDYPRGTESISCRPTSTGEPGAGHMFIPSWEKWPKEISPMILVILVTARWTKKRSYLCLGIGLGNGGQRRDLICVWVLAWEMARQDSWSKRYFQIGGQKTGLIRSGLLGSLNLR